MKQALKVFEGIHWRFVIIYLLLILIAMQVISAYFSQRIEAHFVNDFNSILDQQTGVLVYSIQSDIQDSPDDDVIWPTQDNIYQLAEQMFASIPQVEFQIIDRNGIVLSSLENPSIVGQRNTQAEVRRSLQGIRDDSIRLHPQSGHRMQVLALPLKVDDEVVGSIYLAASMEELYETISEINLILATGTLIALILTALIGVTLARTITAPIKEMTDQTTAMTEGDFSRQVRVYGKDEIGRLAQGINELSRRLHQALSDKEEEKNKLASILANMSDGVVAADRKGRIILMNQKAEGMLDQKEIDVLGLKISDVLSFPEAVEQETMFLENGRFLLDFDQEELPFALQINVSPLHGGETLQGIIAVLQDVTQQEQLERDRKEFVANVSHELRTPLTTIKSYIEALLDGAMTEPKLTDKFLGVVHQETGRMIRLVHDLLQLSKMDTKRIPLHLEETNLEQLVRQVVDRFAIPLKQRDLRLESRIESNLPVLRLDQDQIIQVLDNILSNAIKYSFAQGTIKVHVYSNAEDVIIEVHDEGIGIPRAEIHHIFKRFYRVDKARSREMGGTGLGLSIAREMILAHNGRIDIESDIGEGTKVTICVPIYLDMRDQGA